MIVSCPPSLLERCKHLIKLYKSSNLIEGKLIVLQELWDLSDSFENKLPFCSDPDLNLLQFIKDSLIETITTPLLLNKLTGILWYLSRDDDCCKILASSSLHLLPIVMVLVRPRNNFAYRQHIINFLSNICMEESCHSYLLYHHDIRLFEFFYNEILVQPSYAQLYKAISNFTQYANNTTIEILINNGSNIPVFFFNKLILIYGSNPNTWHPFRYNGVPYFLLNFFIRLVYFPIGCKIIKEHGSNDNNYQCSVRNERWLDLVNTYFINIIESGCKIEGLKSLFILLQLNQDDDLMMGKISELCSKYNYLIVILLQLFNISMNYEENIILAEDLYEEGLVYGIILLRQTTRVLKILLSDHRNYSNLQSHLSIIMKYSLQALNAFIDNQTEFHCYLLIGKELSGGGRNDYDTLENVVEILLLLYYLFFDNNNNNNYYKMNSKSNNDSLRNGHSSYMWHTSSYNGNGFSSPTASEKTRRSVKSVFIENEMKIRTSFSALINLPKERCVPTRVIMIAKLLLDILG
eukprot:gene1256-1331_t